MSHHLTMAADKTRHLAETSYQILEHLREVATLLEESTNLRRSHAELVDQVEGLKVELHDLRNRITVYTTAIECIRDIVSPDTWEVSAEEIREVLRESGVTV